MTTVESTLEFLSDLPIYQETKPFIATYDSSDGVHRGDTQNVEWTEHRIKIHDIRAEQELSLATSGFEVFSHHSECLPIPDREHLELYRHETQDFLRKTLRAQAVLTYDVKLRYCGDFNTSELVDLGDIMSREGPPNGAHNSSFESAPKLIQSRLAGEDAAQFMKPGYRFRIINTWRPLLPEIEHRPLAVCDFRSVEARNLVATDRVYPHRVLEVYYLTYNPNQRWYWYSKQTRDDLLLMMTYDTHSNGKARYCPHVSFHNPLAAEDAPPRESVETRSIVISKVEI